jgi:O-antigen/teichoic acid export membrane protein
VGSAARLGAEYVAGTALSQLCSLVFIAVAVRGLGEDGFGIYRVILQVVTVSALTGHAGFGAVAVRAASQARARGGSATTKRIALAAAVAAGAVSGVVAAAAFGAADSVARVLVDEGAGATGSLLRLGIACAPLLAVAEVLRLSTDRGRARVVSHAVPAVLQVVLGAAAVLAGLGLSGAVGALLIGAVLSVTVAWLSVREELPEVGGELVPFLGDLKPVGSVLSRWAATLVSIPALAPAIFLVALLGADRDVGLFGVALALNAVGGILPSAIGFLLGPVALDLFERADVERLQAAMQRFTARSAAVALPVYMALVVVPEPFVWMLTGDAASPAVPAVAAMAAGYLLWAPTAPCTRALGVARLAHLNVATSAGALACYVGTGMWALPRWGLIGMALVHGTVVALLGLVRLLQVILFLGLHPVGASVVPCLAASAAAGLAVAACKWAGPPVPLTLVVALPLFATVYVLVLRALEIRSAAVAGVS